MNKRNVERDILDRLNAYVSAGTPLPVTNDGKVNISALCRSLKLKPSDAQHFHRKLEIKTTVNALCEEQGLLPIGARADLQDSDKAIQTKIQETTAQAKRDGQAAAEAKAQYLSLFEELKVSRADNQKLRFENRRLKEQLHMVREGIIPE